jgi:diguanylate cyclase (GGDEF)-like protein
LWCALVTTATIAWVLCRAFVPRPHGGTIAWLDTWFYDGVSVLAGIVMLVGAKQTERDRRAWRIVGIAMLIAAIGDISWTALFDRAEISLADAAYLAFYPLLFVAVVRLVRNRAPRRDSGQWLDNAVVGLGVAAIAAAFVFKPLMHYTGGGHLATAVNLAYPIADVLIIALLVAGLASVGWRPDRNLLAASIGLGITTVGDLIYLVRSPDSTAGGAIIDSAWIIGNLLLALAPWFRQVATSEPETEASPGRTRLILSSIIASASVLLLLIATQWRLSIAAVVLATLALAAARVRAILAYREVRSIAVLQAEARTDELTGLLNRRGFVSALDAELLNANDDHPVSVLLIDLNDFKEVNDTLGHQRGDDLLIGVGRLLRSNVYAIDTVARLGGDEFAVIMPGLNGSDAYAAAEKLRRAINAPIVVGSMSIAVEASIGVSTGPLQADDTTTLLRFADIAMYDAKRRRCGTVAYATSSTNASTRDRLELAQQIREGVTGGQIVLHYQPKVEIVSGRVIGTEALARWKHPTRGLLQPAEFLPLVEQTGLDHELTRAVLTAAVRQLAQWRARNVSWNVAVNVVPADLLDESLPRFVTDLLNEYAVHPRQLVLEITEGALVADPVRAARTVRRLRAAGTQISLDDFGVGFSSLVHLRTMEFDELKLDRTLAIDLELDSRGQAIVRAAVELASSLHLRLVVEGVETELARDTLAHLGARFVQGWLYSRALPADELERWASDRRARRRVQQKVRAR